MSLQTTRMKKLKVLETKNEKMKKRCVCKPPEQKIETLKDESLER